MKKGFDSGELDEDAMSDANETHFIVNMDNGKILGVSRDQEVKYEDVTSSEKGMTMLVRLSGGLHAVIQPPFMIFTNKDRSHPIRDVLDTVTGMAHRTGPKGWMDSKIIKM